MVLSCDRVVWGSNCAVHTSTVWRICGSDVIVWQGVVCGGDGGVYYR